MTIELETRLEEHFRNIEVQRFDVASQRVAIEDRARRRRHRRVALRVVSVALIGFGATAVLMTRDHGLPEDSAATNGAIGTPIVVSDEDQLYTDLVKPGALSFELADGTHLTFAITAAPFFDGYGQQTTVAYEGYATGRFQSDAAELPLIPEPELGGNDRIVFWTGIPTSANRVELRLDGGPTLTQRPIQGIAAFPVQQHSPGDTITAFAADGSIVATATWSQVRVVGTGSTNGGAIATDYSSLPPPANYGVVDVSRLEGLTQAQEDAYRAFGNDTMRACLSADGANWTACIQSTDAAVKTYLEDLQPAG